MNVIDSWQIRVFRLNVHDVGHILADWKHSEVQSVEDNSSS